KNRAKTSKRQYCCTNATQCGNLNRRKCCFYERHRNKRSVAVLFFGIKKITTVSGFGSLCFYKRIFIFTRQRKDCFVHQSKIWRKPNRAKRDFCRKIKRNSANCRARIPTGSGAVFRSIVYSRSQCPAN